MTTELNDMSEKTDHNQLEPFVVRLKIVVKLKIAEPLGGLTLNAWFPINDFSALFKQDFEDSERATRSKYDSWSCVDHIGIYIGI